MPYNAPIADFVTTSLSGVLAAGATSATIGTGLNIPANNGILHLSYDTANAIGATDGPETISYTSYTTGTGALAGLTRGLAGTTDVQHSNGQSVQQAPSALLWGNNQITGNMLSTTAITLGYAEITSSFTTSTTPAFVDVTGLATTFTVPAGGRRVKVTAFAPAFKSSGAGNTLVMAIRNGATTLSYGVYDSLTANYRIPMCVSYSAVLAAATYTYKVSINQSAGGTLAVDAGATQLPFILVELV